MSWYLDLKTTMPRVYFTVHWAASPKNGNVRLYVPTLAWVQYFGLVIWEGTQAQTLVTPEFLPHWTNEEH